MTDPTVKAWFCKYFEELCRLGLFTETEIDEMHARARRILRKRKKEEEPPVRRRPPSRATKGPAAAAAVIPWS